MHFHTVHDEKVEFEKFPASLYCLLLQRRLPSRGLNYGLCDVMNPNHDTRLILSATMCQACHAHVVRLGDV